MSAADFGFLVSRRWIILHLVALLGIGLFVTAGFWQLSRLSDRLGRNALIEQRASEPPVPVGVALAEVPPGTDPGAALEFRTVLASGTYDPEREILVLSRSLNGQPGFHVVTPLVLDGEAVLVNRGFVPQALDDPPVAAALPPSGRVTVEGRVRSSVDPPAIGPRDSPEGPLEKLFWLHVPRVAQQMPYGLLPVTVELVSQSPPSDVDLPIALPEPVLDEGPHRGYAIQWFSFAVIAAVGYAFFIRRAARRPGEQRPGPSRRSPPRAEGASRASTGS